ncbi:MAG: restriction endonuclease subunit S [Candidatus Bathyarchaeota archaeon]|nr:restriction endonuclease subunit S [Candidatus Bathyarchaeota archaeon]
MKIKWNTNRLGDHVEKIGSGATPRGGSKVYLDSGVTLIRSQNVHNSSFNPEGLVFISEEHAKKLDNVEVKPRDILLNLTGDSVARVCQVPKFVLPARVNQHVAIIRPDNRIIDSDFLHFYLTSPYMQSFMLMLAGAGATRKALTKGMIEDFEIPTPSLIEQKAIAKFLKAIENKIMTNNLLNLKLEELAETIFKHWFINFEFPNEFGNPYRGSGGAMEETPLGEIPQNWEFVSIGEISHITMGQSPPGISYNEEQIGLPFYQGIRDFGFRYPSKRVYCIDPKRVVEEGTVLLSVRAPVGSVNLAKEKTIIGRGLCGLNLKKGYNGFLYYFLRTNNDFWNIYNSEGTVFGAIKKSDIQKMLIIQPEEGTLSDFNSMIKTLDNYILLVENQNILLCEIRDSLLPRLMSGKIRVPVEEE